MAADPSKNETRPAAPEIDPRVQLAAERTLLAWIRTGIALMGFGFVVARFGMFLREVTGQAALAASSHRASAVGVLLVASGLILNAWSSVRHVQMMRAYEGGQPLPISARGPATVGMATAVGGLVLLGVLLLAME